MAGHSRALAKLQEKHESLKRSKSNALERARGAPKSTAVGTFAGGKVAAVVAGAMAGYAEEDSMKPAMGSLATGILLTGAGAFALSQGMTGGSFVTGAGSSLLDISVYEGSKRSVRKYVENKADKA